VTARCCTPLSKFSLSKSRSLERLSRNARLALTGFALLHDMHDRLGEHVAFDVHDVADFRAAQRGDLERRGNQRDTK